MTRARRIKIRGHHWRIIIGRPPHNNCGAICDYDTRTIYIRKGEDRTACVVHEILHALFPDCTEDVIEEAEAAIVKGLELVA